MLAAGYEEPKIRAELKRHNYADDAIDEAMKLGKAKVHIPKPQEHHYEVPPARKQQQVQRTMGLNFHESFFISLSVIFLFFFIGWINLRTGASLGVLFLCFIPTFMTIVFTILLYSGGSDKFRMMVWVIPLLTSMGFFVLATETPMLNDVDVGNVTILNFALSFIFIVLLNLFEALDKAFISPILRALSHSEKKVAYHHHPPESHHQQGQRVTEEHTSSLENKVKVHTQEQSIEQYIQSIEDKSKALNFVIGRVYSNKHGGSDDLRGRIRIKKEWYNIFAEIPADEINLQLRKLRQAVQLIGERLALLQHTEVEIFGGLHTALKNIERQDAGHEKVIDILARNDKDPVMTYYNSAIEFCEKAMEEIDQLARNRVPEESRIIESNVKQDL